MFANDYYGHRAIRMTKRIMGGDSVTKIAHDEGIGKERVRQVLAQFIVHLRCGARGNPKGIRENKRKVEKAMESWAISQGLDLTEPVIGDGE